MRNMKKILSFVLVLMLAFSACVVSASAADTDQTIYFEVPADWANYSKIFCHIWPYGGDPFANWQSKKEACTATETEGVYSYNITKVGELVEGEYYCVIFSADTAEQTYDCLMGFECIGDTLYVDPEVVFENPQDSSKTCQGAFWRNQDPAKYGPMMQVTSIGNLVGTALPPGQTAEDVFTSFITANLENAQTYSGKDDQAIIDDVAEALNLDDETVDKIITENSQGVTWTLTWNGKTYGGSTVSTDDEISTDDEASTDEIGLLGDANMDGKVNVKDATYIQKAAADLLTLTETEAYLADVDGSGIVNVKDATAIQKYVADMETGFDIGFKI